MRQPADPRSPEKCPLKWFYWQTLTSCRHFQALDTSSQYGGSAYHKQNNGTDYPQGTYSKCSSCDDTEYTDWLSHIPVTIRFLISDTRYPADVISKSTPDTVLPSQRNCTATTFGDDFCSSADDKSNVACKLPRLVTSLAPDMSPSRQVAFFDSANLQVTHHHDDSKQMFITVP